MPAHRARRCRLGDAGKKAGIPAYITKPISRQELKAKLSFLLAGGA